MSSSSKNYVQKTLCFNACNRGTESMNQQTPATPASELKEFISNRKAVIKKSKVKKENGMMTISSMDFFFSRAENQVFNHLHNACFVMLLMETKVWFLRNYAIIWKTNTAFI